MIRFLWPIAMLLLGATVVFAQLDRQSRIDPHLSRYVPAPFASFARFNRTIDAIETGSPDEALAEAKHLLARRPIPAEHLSLVAIAQAKGGDEAAALRTIQLSAQRGWRDPYAQEIVFRLALDAGDYDEAANRLAALWATGTDREALIGFARDLGSSPAGRKALEEAAERGGPWSEGYRRMEPSIFGEQTE